MNILVTSGGTRVPIDRVRHIGNMSNGTFASRIAIQLLRNARWLNRLDDLKLTFFHARHSKTPFTIPVNVLTSNFNEQRLALSALHDEVEHYSRAYEEQTYGNFNEYAQGLRLAAPRYNVIILAAAVSDYLPKIYVDAKIRSKNALNIELEPAPKLISEIRSLNPSCSIVGFKLLVDSNDSELIAAAQESAIKNDCAFVVANDLRDIQRGKHRVMLVNKKGLVQMREESQDDPNELADFVAKAVWADPRSPA